MMATLPSTLAVDYWLEAGQLVFQRLAHAEAVAHLSRGLALLDGLPLRPNAISTDWTFRPF